MSVSKIIICVAFLTSCLWSDQDHDRRTLVGTLYSIQGGPSVLSAGDIRLKVNNQVYLLHYRKPISNTFVFGTCDDVGSIWTVIADITTVNEGVLLSAQCSGKPDEPIRRSLTVVRRFFSFTQQRAFESAYSLFTKKWKDNHSIEQFVQESNKLDLSKYGMLGRSGRCLEVDDSPSMNHVIIKAGIDCFVFGGKRPLGELVFDVVRNGKSPVWLIDEVKTVDYSGGLRK